MTEYKKQIISVSQKYDIEREDYQRQIEIPAEVILDLDEPMKLAMKDTIYKAFSEETPINKMCEYIKGKLLEKEEGYIILR